MNGPLMNGPLMNGPLIKGPFNSPLINGPSMNCPLRRMGCHVTTAKKHTYQNFFENENGRTKFIDFQNHSIIPKIRLKIRSKKQKKNRKNLKNTHFRQFWGGMCK